MSSRPAPVLAALTRDSDRFRPALAALLAVAGGGLLLHLVPALEMELFARVAAAVASALTGSPMIRVDEGWMLAGLTPRLVVSPACSATDYFLITATVLAWHFARRAVRIPVAIAGGLLAALPVTWLVNAVRIVVVGQVHARVIPLFPEAYAAFLHLCAGVLVFLPALVVLNLLIESHGNHVRRSRSPG
jgi:exosortase/archaeosortase family protein